MTEQTWDDRLLSRADALEAVGRWPLLVVYYEGEGAAHLHCDARSYSGHGTCYQSAGRFVRGYHTDLEDILAGVLRHAVVAHDLALGHHRGPGAGKETR